MCVLLELPSNCPAAAILRFTPPARPVPVEAKTSHFAQTVCEAEEPPAHGVVAPALALPRPAPLCAVRYSVAS